MNANGVERATPSAILADASFGSPKPLTVSMIGKIENGIKAGLQPEDSAALVGASKRTFKRWMQIGAEESLRVETDNEVGGSAIVSANLKIYVYLFQRVNQMIAEAEAGALARIRRAGTGNAAEFDDQGNMTRKERGPQWGADAWFLERRFPDRYGRQMNVKEEKNINVSMSADLKKLRGAADELKEWEEKMGLDKSKAVDAEIREMPEK